MLIVYIQEIITPINCEAGFPIPLVALQRYIPVLELVMFAKFQDAPLCRTSLSVPPGSTLVQVMFGGGNPDASQNSCRLDPSFTEWLGLPLLTFVSLGGAKRK